MEDRRYDLRDLVRVPLRVAPVATILWLLLTALLGLWMFLEVLMPARFVDTAVAVLRGEAAYADIYAPILLTALTVAFSWVSGQARNLLVARVRLALRDTVREGVVEKCARLEYRHIENPETWDLIGRVRKEPENQFCDGLSALCDLCALILRVVSIIALMLYQVWWAAVVILLLSTPLIVLAIKGGKANYDMERETARAERKYNYLFDMLLSREGAEERALFGCEGTLAEEMSREFRGVVGLRLLTEKRWFFRCKLGGVLFGCVSLLIALVLMQPTVQGTITIGMFMALVNASFSLVQRMSWNLIFCTGDLAKRREYMKDLTELMHLEESAGALEPAAPGLRLESLVFKNVRFRYPGTERYVLDGLNLDIRAGRHYAFVGVNGAGKTTVTKLLTGLYDDFEGEILLNGKDIRAWPPNLRKGMCSVAYQDFARYEVTLSDNLTLGYADRVSGVPEALRAAGLTEVAERLPKGAQTPLGRLLPEGQELSGGEWQRVAIARALNNPARLRILDEPTAALDPIAESEIYRQFERASQGVTTLFISHRLGSTKLADTIFVLGEGRVLESGGHAELLQRGGLYAEMYEAQRSWYQ